MRFALLLLLNMPLFAQFPIASSFPSTNTPVQVQRGGSVLVSSRGGDDCGPVQISASPGYPVGVNGTPFCVFDLYSCEQSPSTYLGSFILDANGFVDTGVIATFSSCYEAFDSDNGNLLGTTMTVPTLSQWGLLLLVTLLLISAIWVGKISKRTTQKGRA